MRIRCKSALSFIELSDVRPRFLVLRLGSDGFGVHLDIGCEELLRFEETRQEVSSWIGLEAAKVLKGNEMTGTEC